MEYRFYEHDTDFWNRENIKVSIEELKRHFGIRPSGKNFAMQQTDIKTEDIEFVLATDERGLHQYKEPAFDIYDEALAEQQLEEFRASGRDGWGE